MLLPEVVVSRILCGWIFVLFAFISFLTKTDEIHIGPSDNLIIFGTMINTKEKYAAIIVLSICNSALRTMNSHVLYPWIINNIQDTKNERVDVFHANEITTVHSIYGFVDWYIYMNILLSHMDLFLLEMGVNLITALFTTRYYLQRRDVEEEVKYTQVNQEEVV